MKRAGKLIMRGLRGLKLKQEGRDGDDGDESASVLLRGLLNKGLGNVADGRPVKASASLSSFASVARGAQDVAVFEAMSALAGSQEPSSSSSSS